MKSKVTRADSKPPDLILAIRIVTKLRQHYLSADCDDCRAHSLKCLDCPTCRNQIIYDLARLLK